MKIKEDLLSEVKIQCLTTCHNETSNNPNCASKFIQVDYPDGVEVSETNWNTWIAYDAEGNSYDIR